MKKSAILLSILLATSMSALAQDDPSLQDFRDAAIAKERAAHAEEQARSDAKAAHDAIFTEKGKLSAATRALANLPNAVTAPSGSGADLHASRPNFLTSLGAAVNAIETAEDKQSVTVRFNPIPTPPLQLGITLVAKKASLYAPISKAIKESERAAAVALLEKGFDDFDDVTASVSLSPATSECGPDQAKRGFGPFGCWGKTSPTKVYRKAFSAILTPSLRKIADAATSPERLALETEFGRLAPGSSARNTAFSSLSAEDQARAKRIVKDLAAAQLNDEAAEKTLFENIDPKALAQLIDNQPVIAINGSYRDLGSLGGPSEIALSAELQFGFENFNTLAKETDQAKVDNTLKGKFRKDSLVISFAYKRHNDYALAALPGLTAVTFDPVSVPSASEWQLKGQWGAPLSFKANDRNARFDLGLDGFRANEDSVRTKNRWIAKATLTLPVGTNFDIPVTLTWANKPEFTGDGQENFGANFSLSYRLPWNLE